METLHPSHALEEWTAKRSSLLGYGTGDSKDSGSETLLRRFEAVFQKELINGLHDCKFHIKHIEVNIIFYCTLQIFSGAIHEIISPNSEITSQYLLTRIAPRLLSRAVYRAHYSLA
jgi:hypothetical protein